jgi:glycoprotein-N-acetylgalactosamine 3-beta-galactosyltransferase
LKTRGVAVHDTWAHKCDGLKFIFSKTDKYQLDEQINNTFKQDDVHDPLTVYGIPDRYQYLTFKVFLTMRNLYRNATTNYDWYLKTDDDTFIFMDNLRKFLADKNASEPVTYGYRFETLVNASYNQGGAYVLSNEALRRFGSQLSRNFTYCNQTGFEDVDVANCLQRLQVRTGNTTDELGRERFHPVDVYSHYYGLFPDWLTYAAQNPLKNVNILN